MLKVPIICTSDIGHAGAWMRFICWPTLSRGNKLGRSWLDEICWGQTQSRIVVMNQWGVHITPVLPVLHTLDQKLFLLHKVGSKLFWTLPASCVSYCWAFHHDRHNLQKLIVPICKTKSVRHLRTSSQKYVAPMWISSIACRFLSLVDPRRRGRVLREGVIVE